MRKLILPFIIIFAFSTYGFTIDENNDLIDLNGVTLESTYEETVDILGHDFNKKLVIDESGYIGEDYYILSYDYGVKIKIGKESNKVIGLEVSSPDIKTNLGYKVGDRANEVLKGYRNKYDEIISRHTNKPVTGWFRVSNETVLIFDFNSDDKTRVNDEVSSDSRAETIELTYIKYFD